MKHPFMIGYFSGSAIALLLALLLHKPIFHSTPKKEKDDSTAELKILSVNAKTEQFKPEIRQSVTFHSIDGKYYLDTWVKTSPDQSHNHCFYEETSITCGGGTLEMNGKVISTPEYMPFDSLVSGSFEYIKSIKGRLYQLADYIYEARIKVESDAKRFQDSITNAATVRRDSVKILNDL